MCHLPFAKIADGSQKPSSIMKAGVWIVSKLAAPAAPANLRTNSEQQNESATHHR